MKRVRSLCKTCRRCGHYAAFDGEELREIINCAEGYRNSVPEYFQTLECSEYEPEKHNSWITSHKDDVFWACEFALVAGAFALLIIGWVVVLR